MPEQVKPVELPSPVIVGPELNHVEPAAVPVGRGELE